MRKTISSIMNLPRIIFLQLVFVGIIFPISVWSAGKTIKSNLVSIKVSPQPQQGTLPSGLGWHVLPDTKMRSVCYPSVSGDGIFGVGGCPAIITAWGSGIADTTRNRMIIWGGGHNDYYGNELYAFNLGQIKWQRLNDPSPPVSPTGGMVLALSDGKANGRHTFDNLAYVKNLDQMYAVGGAPSSGNGGLTSDTWLLNLSNLFWDYKSPAIAGATSGIVGAADYDPNTNLVFLDAQDGYYSYNPSSNQYTRISNGAPDYHYTGRVDPVQKKFFIASGEGFWLAGISSTDTDKTLKKITMTGCAGLQTPFPGLTFDSQLGKLVGWAGGNTVYTVDLVNRSCTAISTYTGGPGAAQVNGTTGRFRYFPDYNVHVLVNDVDQNVFILRLSN